MRPATILPLFVCLFPGGSGFLFGFVVRMNGLFVVDVEVLYELVEGLAALLVTWNVVVESFWAGFVNVLVIRVAFVGGKEPGAVDVMLVCGLSEGLVDVPVGMEVPAASLTTNPVVDDVVKFVPFVELFIGDDEELGRYATV